MILDALFRWFAQSLAWLLSGVPGMPSLDLASWQSSIGPVFEYMAWANQYVPLDQAFIAVGILFAGWAIFYGVDLVEWVLTKLHILGGNSR